MICSILAQPSSLPSSSTTTSTPSTFHVELVPVSQTSLRQSLSVQPCSAFLLAWISLAGNLVRKLWEEAHPTCRWMGGQWKLTIKDILLQMDEFWTSRKWILNFVHFKFTWTLSVDLQGPSSLLSSHPPRLSGVGSPIFHFGRQQQLDSNFSVWNTTLKSSHFFRSCARRTTSSAVEHSTSSNLGISYKSPNRITKLYGFVWASVIV